MDNFNNAGNVVEMIDPTAIHPCPYQTRKTFGTHSLQQLIGSIKENGILQPLTATRIGNDFQLIAGHRRLLAARVLKLEAVPVIVLQKSETEIAVLCTIENLHREDLNFFEQAEAINVLIEKLGLTQAQAGEKLSLTQPAIANKLKLLQLTQSQQKEMLQAGLCERHARAICRLETQQHKKAIDYIVKNNLNVAKTDEYIESLLNKQIKHKQTTIINIKDVRLFTNTITKAVKIMQSAGFCPMYEQTSTQEAIEYKIVIPFTKKPQQERHSKTAVNI